MGVSRKFKMKGTPKIIEVGCNEGEREKRHGQFPQ